MFIGHIAAGLAAKRLSPRTSLPTLIVAATLLDIIWPVLVLLGIEHVAIEPGNTAVTPLNFIHYPYSHSLLAALLLAAGFGFVYYFFNRYRTGAVVVGLLVASHWLLDLVSHRPDLPLAPDVERYVGLGLWNSLALTAVVELGLFLWAVRIYGNYTRRDSLAGRVSFWSFVAALLILQVMAYQGTPPPSVEAVAWSGIAAWLFIPWALWIEKTRRVPGIRYRR